MSDYNEQTLMEAVIKRVAATPDPRLRQIMTSLVKHLHGCVREVRPTWEELLAGIQFLTAVGQKCDDKRQEFILLSDSLGVSMLVDLISYGKVGNATESDLLGPAWVEAAPELPLGSNLATHPSDGEPCVITGSVASLDGTPLAGAVVDFWEADGDGFYDLQKPSGPNLRARLRTDDSGQFWFLAVRPVSYGIPTDGPVGAMLRATNRHNMRAAHLHFMISAPAHDRLVTQLFLTGDQYLDSDSVFGVKESLVVDCDPLRRMKKRRNTKSRRRFIVCTTTLCSSLPRHGAFLKAWARSMTRRHDVLDPNGPRAPRQPLRGLRRPRARVDHRCRCSTTGSTKTWQSRRKRAERPKRSLPCSPPCRSTPAETRGEDRF